MTQAAPADGVRFFVFDDFTDPPAPFRLRIADAAAKVIEAQKAGLPVSLVEHTYVFSQQELDAKLVEFLDAGWEGLMCRDIDGRYKFGRSGKVRPELVKFKPWQDAEAVIIGFAELQHNANAAEQDAMGLTKRSSHKENQVAGGTLGALHVQDRTTGVTFGIGTGLTSEMRDELWAQRDSLIGQIVKYRSVPVGVKDAPRFPSFIGIRHPEDIGGAP
jgi:DNA ligase-1